jgi:hypothetical protein
MHRIGVTVARAGLSAQVDGKPMTTTAEIRMLLAMAQLVVAEIAAYEKSRTRMPRVRFVELLDSLEPATSHAQRWWFDLPADDRAAIDRARAVMIARQRSRALDKVPL